MLRDQVRRTKNQRSVPTSRRASRSSTSSNPPRKVARVSRTTSWEGFNFILIVAVVLLLLGSVWYGMSQIVTFLTRVPSPRLTLIVSNSSNEAVAQSVWLLAEGKTISPRYFLLSAHSELTTGMMSGRTWTDVAQMISDHQNSQQSRLLASQALGLPIERIVKLNTSETKWPSVVAELRNTLADSLRNGSFSVEKLQFWLLARMSEGDYEKSYSIEAITSQISRQNLSAITAAENCPIAVLNNSGKSGFASLVGKILEQNGGSVLRVANALSAGETDAFDQNETLILLNPQLASHCSETLSTMKLLFPDLQISENESLANQYRANLVFVVGLNAQLEPTADAPSPHQ